MKTKIYLQWIVFSILMLYAIRFSGQEMNGLIFSEYSGITGSSINPALMTGSKTFVDINLIGGSGTASNDIAYFLPENHTMLKFIKKDTFELNDGNFKYNRSYNYFNNKDKKYLNVNARVLGPSAMVQYEHHAFGISTAFRSVHGGKNIPYEMPVILYEGLEYPDIQGKVYDDYNFSFVSMTWSEIGLSYAYDFINYYDNKVTFGISAKALFAYEGAYASIEHANYVVHNKEDVEFIDVDAEIGFALPYDESELAVDIDPLTKGHGYGIDIGFVYTKKESLFDHQGYRALCTNPYQEYKWRVGLSILDIGSVKFDEDTERYKFENASANWVDYDTTQFLGLTQTLQTYSKAFYGDPDAAYAGNTLKIGLPTTVSLQFDYKIREKYYVSALWMQPIRLNLNTLWRPAQIAVTPRYETRMVGVSVPFSLYNYTEPRLGLAVRFYSLSIGTDRLGAFLGVSKFAGMDIYFSLKFNLIKGDCLRFKGSDW